ncbi:efflux RND transporter periplasmic adaptor subunit [Roseiconus lacunae]|uniref:HlyD family efflux transporter periplasmic adaptor subunit n=1 Tax=Roseiconus lacunae TaxID=2605694 RepID=A0ABT7PLY0_9BACT|nr:HlyD family efflux transporter periplasmic adaptor subunit [Roseiconus lacunae]MCD0458064.1 HlyD family efflux transporter periplasmic adaptor subunit [Roseiconus lacunae]MDM4017496.1 HlyD family efflux transporter periplasmic adaptor subunit [Roseiconus lacunae]
MKRPKRFLLWGSMIIAGAFALYFGFRPQPIAVDYVSPVRDQLEITVDDDGETRIREKYTVSAPVTGKLLRVVLDPGDEVTQGETELAQIKPVDPALLDVRSRAEAEARVRAAQAAMQQADAAVVRANETLQLAEQDLKRADRLRAKNALSDADYDQVQSRHRIAVAERRSAEFAARVATYEVDQAEAALQYTASDDGDLPDETAFRVLSPINGRVLNVFLENSTVVSAGESLMEVGDPKDMELKIDVLSIDAVRVRPGNSVYIEHWGGDQTLRGTVRLVEPAAFLKVSALGVEEKRVNVLIDFDDPWEVRQTLGDGFRVEARIVIDQSAPQGLILSSAALFTEQDQWMVFKVLNGIATKQLVEVGKTNGMFTEISSGLEEQDVVIEHPPDTLTDGTKVRPIR